MSQLDSDNTQPTWVLLRGLIREQRHWEDFPEAMASAFPDQCIVTVDIAGNGARYKETSPHTVAGLMESARHDLQQRGIAPPYHLLAISLGGMIAMEWMVTHPDEITQGVLMNTSLSAFSRFTERLSPRQYRKIINGFLTSDLYERENLILEITSNLRADHADIALRWASYATQYPISRSNALRQLYAAARYKQPYRQPTQPLHLLTSAEDKLVNASCSFEVAKRWGLPIYQHPLAGHDLPLDDAQWVIEQLTQLMPTTR